MARKAKYTSEQKLWAVNEYLSGNKGVSEIAKILKMSKTGAELVRQWICQFKQNGTDAFTDRPHNRSYSKAFKEQVVQEYLREKMGTMQLAAKYSIPSSSTVKNWVSKYNNQLENRDYCPRPEVYMAPKRKTTLEERIEIARWCLDNDKNYKEAASRFNCSYGQVRTWTLKLEREGEEGLKDGRGRKKAEDELSNEEKFKRKLAQLEARNKYLEMENEVLKKAEELERRLIDSWER